MGIDGTRGRSSRGISLNGRLRRPSAYPASYPLFIWLRESRQLFDCIWSAYGVWHLETGREKEKGKEGEGFGKPNGVTASSLLKSLKQKPRKTSASPASPRNMGRNVQKGKDWKERTNRGSYQLTTRGPTIRVQVIYKDLAYLADEPPCPTYLDSGALRPPELRPPPRDC